jgi:hypothetical protein
VRVRAHVDALSGQELRLANVGRVHLMRRIRTRPSVRMPMQADSSGAVNGRDRCHKPLRQPTLD